MEERRNAKKVWLEDLKGINNLKELRGVKRILLKWMLIGFAWLTAEKNRRIL
jgi:hypothetical protein